MGAPILLLFALMAEASRKMALPAWERITINLGCIVGLIWTITDILTGDI